MHATTEKEAIKELVKITESGAKKKKMTESGNIVEKGNFAETAHRIHRSS